MIMIVWSYKLVHSFILHFLTPPGVSQSKAADLTMDASTEQEERDGICDRDSRPATPRSILHDSNPQEGNSPQHNNGSRKKRRATRGKLLIGKFKKPS